jgi:hypothetical protein
LRVTIIHTPRMNDKQQGSWDHFQDELNRRKEDPLIKPDEFIKFSRKFGFGFFEYLFTSYLVATLGDEIFDKEEFMRYYGLNEKFLTTLEKRREAGLADGSISVEEKEL